VGLPEGVLPERFIGLNKKFNALETMVDFRDNSDLYVVSERILAVIRFAITPTIHTLSRVFKYF
jgi:hypothetical protein